MGTAFFYHLTRSPVEATLPMLLEKSLAAGWRVAVRGGRPDRLVRLDETLWLEPEDGFLPHGLAGQPWEAEQPVLLTPGPVTNGATCLMAIDGAEISAEEAIAAERVCILFDGTDSSAVEAARAQWRRLTAAGVPSQYWSEETGRWQKKAER